MHSPQAKNYLLSNRKRLMLSQEEIAFLLGAETGDKVCRHERFQREPSLDEALAYEAIYRLSASELFGGKYREIEAAVQMRAKALLAKADGEKATARGAHKRRVLAKIAGN